jgi:hypothetical protein
MVTSSIGRVGAALLLTFSTVMAQSVYKIDTDGESIRLPPPSVFCHHS